jgi:hypothetical protein
LELAMVSSKSTTLRHPAISFAFKQQRVMERDEETSRSLFFPSEERQETLSSHLELVLYYFPFIQEEKSIFRVLTADGTAHDPLYRSVQCLYYCMSYFWSDTENFKDWV